jgi:serine/threonine protein kinase/tetratricopeptide (TPR) repeat protein/WD40 repeat protein
VNERNIFIEALQKASDDEREQFLDAACGDDAGLRQRVAGLLRDALRIGDFLESPAVNHTSQFAATLPPEPSEKIGDRIGPYKLLQVIGQGGMGVVYMAEQHEPVSRRVALKIIKPGMDTQQVVTRFEAERQALALMDHPGIAKVLDAGATASGRPFFAMELVKGVPMTEYCDKQRLTLEQRLELFLHVCQAVQHAHQKGIIHRDLKPSNVLVALYDGHPVPKVIDFGVAKATSQRLTEKTMFTEFGQVVGTLDYMSPEQAELSQLDIDTRSDIYSLGVMLYELLTGTTPFEKKRLRSAAFVEVLRIIREEDPPKPSTRLSTTGQLPSIAASRGLPPQRLTSLIRGDLDWIVMKTLEKDRSRRYETANGLARDIERYLQDEPVLACPPSTAYRFRKFLRRNRRQVIAASLILLAVMAGIAGTSAGLMQAALERTAKFEARNHADMSERLARAAERAEKIARHAEDEAKSLLTRAQAAEREVKIQNHLNRARLHRSSGGPGQRFQCLEEVAAAAALNPSPEMKLVLRNEAVAALMLVDIRPGPMIDNLSLADEPVAIDSDFQHYALRMPDGSIAVRRIGDHHEVARMPSPKVPLHSFAFHKGGRALRCIQSNPTETFVWDLEAGREILRVPGQLVCFVAGRRLFTRISPAEDVHVFDSAGHEESRLNVGKGWHAFALDAEEQRLAVSQPGTLQIWDVSSGRILREIPAMSGCCGSVAWDPRGRFLAGFRDSPNVLTVWDLENNCLQAKSRVPVSRSWLWFHPSGELIMSDGWDNVLRFWNPWTGEHLLSVAGANTNGHRGFSADGRLLAATRSVTQVQFWDVSLPSPYRRAFATPLNEGAVGEVRFHPGGRLFATEWGPRAGMRLWDIPGSRNLGNLPFCMGHFDLRNGQLICASDHGLHVLPIHEISAESTSVSVPGTTLKLGPARQIANVGPVHRFDLAQDGRLAAVQRPGQPILVVDLTNPSQAIEVPVTASGHSVRIDPSGRWLATVPERGDDLEEPVRIWDAVTGTLAAELPKLSHIGTLHADFSGDGNWLATSAPAEYRLWKAGNWEPGPMIRREEVSVWPGWMSFSRDGRMWAINRSRETMSVLSTASVEELFTLDLRLTDALASELSFSFSVDGSHLAIRSKIQSVDILDLRSIRAELGRINLDWDLPPFAPARVQILEPIVRFEVDLDTYGTLLRRFTQPQKYLEQGLAHETAQRFIEALEDYTNGLAIKPQNPTLLAGCARMHARLNRGDEAGSIVRRLVSVEPGEFDPHQIAVECEALARRFCFETGSGRRPDDALLLAKRANKLEPDNGHRLWHVGLAQCRLQQYEDAVPTFKASISASPAADRTCVFLGLALAEYHRGNVDEAKSCWDKVRAPSWGNPDLNSLGSEVRNLLEPPPPANATPGEAIEHWTKRLILDPKELEAYIQRSWLFETNGRYEEALKDYLVALKLNPGHPGLLAGSALNHARLGHVEEARADSQRLAMLEPGDFDAARISAMCSYLAAWLSYGPAEIRLPNEAVLVSERAVRLAPNWGPYHHTLGMAYYSLNRWDDAARELKAAMEKPNRVSVGPGNHFSLAMVEFRRGNVQAANDHLERGRKLFPGDNNDPQLKALRDEAETLAREAK